MPTCSLHLRPVSFTSGLPPTPIIPPSPVGCFLLSLDHSPSFQDISFTYGLCPLTSSPFPHHFWTFPSPPDHPHFTSGPNPLTARLSPHLWNFFTCRLFFTCGLFPVCAISLTCGHLGG